MTINSPEPDETIPPFPSEEIPTISPEDPPNESAVPAEPAVLAEEGTVDSTLAQEPAPIAIPEHLLSEDERIAQRASQPPPIAEPAITHEPQVEIDPQPALTPEPAIELQSERVESIDTNSRRENNSRPDSTAGLDDTTGIDDSALSQERARRFGLSRNGGAVPPVSSTEADATQIIDPTQGSPVAPVNYVPTAHSQPNNTQPNNTQPNNTQPNNTQPSSAPTSQLPVAHSPITDEPAHPASSRPHADLFAGLEDMPASRAAAHWWVILATLIFTPVAWFLISDGGQEFARTITTRNAVSVSAMVQLIGGLIALFVIFLAARWSSVGPVIIGTVSMLIGGVFIVIPELTMETLTEYHHVFARLGQLGQSVFEQLSADGLTGRLFGYGLVLTMAGVISHGARRQGRREERRRIALEL